MLRTVAGDARGTSWSCECGVWVAGVYNHAPGSAGDDESLEY